jgi:sugar lactone lactonase YvrE
MRNYLLSVALLLTAAACSKKGSTPGGTPVSGDATVTTVVGKPTALTYGPSGVTSDSKGNIFFAETTAGSIYKLTPDGTVSAYAGSDGNFGDDNGPGASATFTDPVSLVTDKNDNIYVADYLFLGIRRISSADVVSVFASVAPSANVIVNPQAICIDPQGNVYTANQEGDAGLAITTAGGVVSQFAGDGVDGFKDGPVAQAEFTSVSGICTDGKGTIYIGDDGKIRKISGGQVTTIAGNGHGYADGKGLAAQFAGAMGLAIDSKGNIYIADTYNNVIRMMTPDLTVTTIAGGADGSADGVGSAAGFYEPTNLCFDPTGHLYVADYGNNMIRKITFKYQSIDRFLTFV